MATLPMARTLLSMPTQTSACPAIDDFIAIVKVQHSAHIMPCQHGVWSGSYHNTITSELFLNSYLPQAIYR